MKIKIRALFKLLIVNLIATTRCICMCIQVNQNASTINTMDHSNRHSYNQSRIHRHSKTHRESKKNLNSNSNIEIVCVVCSMHAAVVEVKNFHAQKLICGCVCIPLSNENIFCISSEPNIFSIIFFCENKAKNSCFEN